MIMLMTVLPARPDYYILARVSKQWVRLIAANKQTELSFVFSLPTGIVEVVKQTLPVPVRQRARFLPLPHETLIKMFPQLSASWGTSRFLEISLYRNMLLEYAKAGRPEMAMFLDGDVVPPDDVFRTFQGKPFDILGGVVRTFNNEWNEVIGAGTFWKPFFTGLDWLSKPPATRIRVDFVNCACMALGPSVLKNETLNFEPYPISAEPYFVSEDHSFCREAMLHGFKVELDGRVRCEHLRATPRGIQWLRP